MYNIVTVTCTYKNYEIIFIVQPFFFFLIYFISFETLFISFDRFTFAVFKFHVPCLALTAQFDEHCCT